MFIVIFLSRGAKILPENLYSKIMKESNRNYISHYHIQNETRTKGKKFSNHSLRLNLIWIKDGPLDLSLDTHGSKRKAPFKLKLFDHLKISFNFMYNNF